MMSPPASPEEVIELLGEDVEESSVARLVDTRASIHEIAAVLDDLDHERRFGERREPASGTLAEVRAILEELSFDDEPRVGVDEQRDGDVRIGELPLG
jgi:hypothetical protein